MCCSITLSRAHGTQEEEAPSSRTLIKLAQEVALNPGSSINFLALCGCCFPPHTGHPLHYSVILKTCSLLGLGLSIDSRHVTCNVPLCSKYTLFCLDSCILETALGTRCKCPGADLVWGWSHAPRQTWPLLSQVFGQLAAEGVLFFSHLMGLCLGG